MYQNMDSEFIPDYISCNLIALPEYSNEYVRLYNLMQGEHLLHIDKMYRIENPYIDEMFNWNYNESKSYIKRTKILELFHSTHMYNVNSIIENNFNWRLSNRHKYGRGVCFATDPSYATLQSCLGNGVYRAMFVVDVIVGHTRIGNRRTILPKWPCDTTVNKNETVYVKYYDHEFSPKYVIYYYTYPIVSSNGNRYFLK